MLWALAVRCGVCFKRATCRENNYAGRTIMPGEHARPGSCRPPSDPTHTVLFLSTAPLFENKVTPRFTAEKR